IALPSTRDPSREYRLRMTMFQNGELPSRIPPSGLGSMAARILQIILLCTIFTARARGGDAMRHSFQIGENDFLLDGKRLQIRCGEVHAPRVPREYWRHRLQMARAMGLNTVCAYLFWNMHEPTPGEFVWSGQCDAAEFCRIAEQEGL